MQSSEREEGGRAPGPSAFARRLLAEWRRLSLPVADGRGGVVLAVSGGADSTALLLACAELSRARRLSLKMTVAHLEHGLRGASGERDARRVGELAESLGLPCVVGRARVGERARATGDNLEQAARRARYEFLCETARGVRACAVLTAHTLDDQAETVLLRLLRGSGADGLGGMHPVRTLERGGEVLLARPLLRWARRTETEDHCRARGVEVSADEMNADERFARVRVRRSLLPLLETFNPRAVETLARTAELLRDDASALDAAARVLLAEAADEEAAAIPEASVIAEASEMSSAAPEAFEMSSADSGADGLTLPPLLRVEVLARAPVALRRRALRLWIARGRGDLRRVESAHVAAVERLLTGERGGRVAELPCGARIERRRGRLRFLCALKPERAG
ncbi:MAG TPA: tRNA lysidine(34) synthetase TilS [Pyrinomonadaceae bacterium]|nr:tRNA lysidine(34) synthetase TilS [Pyrinomonadaceae bacterium]